MTSQYSVNPIIADQWPQARPWQRADRREWRVHLQGPQHRLGRACCHPKGASTNAYLLCCRLLTYVQYVGETTPRICTLVNALILNHQVDLALVSGHERIFPCSLTAPAGRCEAADKSPATRLRARRTRRLPRPCAGGSVPCKRPPPAARFPASHRWSPSWDPKCAPDTIGVKRAALTRPPAPSRSRTSPCRTRSTPRAACRACTVRQPKPQDAKQKARDGERGPRQVGLPYGYRIETVQVPGQEIIRRCGPAGCATRTVAGPRRVYRVYAMNGSVAGIRR